MEEANASNGCSITVPLIGDGEDLKSVVISHYHEHLQSRGGGTTSFSKTCLNGLNALSGVGILSIPYALSSGGWFSLLLLILIAIAAFYTSLLITKCMDLNPNIRSYPDIGECAFGRIGRLVVSVFMNLELFLVATGFLILEGDNLCNLFSNVGKQGFVIIVGLIVLPTVWLNNMTILSYISATGVIASLLILGSIMWTATFDGIGFKEKGTPLNWSGIPIAISLYSFCYCAHPVFPTLYSSMANKHQFPKVLLLCFVVCTISYATMAIVGYLMFGSKLVSQITLNLPVDNVSSRVATYTTIINPLSKYALMLTPIVNAIENRIPSKSRRWHNRIIIGTILVMSSIVVALVVPCFGYLMSLVGAFLSVSASFLLPCLCYLKISGIYRKFGFQLVIIWSILLVGASTLIVGTYTSLLEIIRESVDYSHK